MVYYPVSIDFSWNYKHRGGLLHQNLCASMHAVMPSSISIEGDNNEILGINLWRIACIMSWYQNELQRDIHSSISRGTVL